MSLIEKIYSKYTNSEIPIHSKTTIEPISIPEINYVLYKIVYENGDEEIRLYYRYKDIKTNYVKVIWDIYNERKLFHIQIKNGNTPIFDVVKPKSEEYIYQLLTKIL